MITNTYIRFHKNSEWVIVNTEKVEYGVVVVHKDPHDIMRNIDIGLGFTINSLEFDKFLAEKYDLVI